MSPVGKEDVLHLANILIADIYDMHIYKRRESQQGPGDSVQIDSGMTAQLEMKSSKAVQSKTGRNKMQSVGRRISGQLIHILQPH